ncbi:nuclear factor 7, ovary-like isoform X2 [Dendropsophus ebraccatus]|uniref:nuclear factor 7, ovary-like isoform X2 n=1 Tax=Dendropsophus ebraccatus TaxID=150705 RepID=UPI0038316145
MEHNGGAGSFTATSDEFTDDAEIVKTRMNKQAGREEFFVHYVALNRRQNEWVDKTRLVIPKPVKEEPAANSTDAETTEDRKAPLKRENDDGSPEAKKVKVDVENSAVSSGDFAEELTCLLCSELFKDPVMVECGHNFCRNCIDKVWNGQESFTCPDCKEVITDKRYTTNRALANLVKKTVSTTAAPAKPTEKPKPAENCPEHDERLKLYCKDDGTLSCVICRDSLKHASHNFLPILDAVGVYRTELSAIVAPLEEALKVTEQLTEEQKEKVEQHKNNVSEFREHIVSEFEKLQSFLKEREEKLLDQLQEQGESLLKEMEANMVKMQENQDNIKETITMANERMNDTDSISFLTGIKSFIDKCQDEQQDVMVSGNTLLSKDLCQGTFKGPIQYSVWKQMKSFIVPCTKEGESLGQQSDPKNVGTSPSKSQVTEHIPPEPQPELIGVQTVWIMGDAVVHRAQARAAELPDGTQLGFPSDKCRLFWFGQTDLYWNEIKNLIKKAENQAPPPNIIVIHAGGNDLPFFSSMALVKVITTDIKIWMEKWPGLRVIWSNIIQRKYSCPGFHKSKIGKSIITVNRFVKRYVAKKGGKFLSHAVIDSKRDTFLSVDGECLSIAGLDLFNKVLKKQLGKCFRRENILGGTPD